MNEKRMSNQIAPCGSSVPSGMTDFDRLISDLGSLVKLAAECRDYTAHISLGITGSPQERPMQPAVEKQAPAMGKLFQARDTLAVARVILEEMLGILTALNETV